MMEDFTPPCPDYWREEEGLRPDPREKSPLKIPDGKQSNPKNDLNFAEEFDLAEALDEDGLAHDGFRFPAEGMELFLHGRRKGR